ncbi:polysaccharide deacetylase family protein (plasmid) [Mesorhizobium sp. WSM2239]|uniref:Chitooligosaccharide deacetylase n=1 Tax=Mesorhizobium sp. WSM2239 TaxID=3228852 RepID=A0AAU8DIP7_9HYPH
MPLSWLARELTAGRLPARAAALTFDDGYGDVFRNALPILEAEQCPATVFVTTGAIGSRVGFWWDQLSRIVYETPSLPDALTLPLAGTVHTFRLADGRGTPDRDTLHGRLHALLKPAGAEARQEALDRLAEWAGAEREWREGDLAMSPDELATLSSAELIEIGAHTVSHPSMPLLSTGDIEREVVASRRDCEAMTGRAVTGFAYPFGDHDVASTAAVRAAGFTHACTTVSRAARRGDDPLAIPRLLAADWDEANFQGEVLTHG